MVDRERAAIDATKKSQSIIHDLEQDKRLLHEKFNVSEDNLAVLRDRGK